MKGRCEDDETSPSPFSYVVSPPREVDGLCQIRPVQGHRCQFGLSLGNV